jgi:hypothetical protein
LGQLLGEVRGRQQRHAPKIGGPPTELESLSAPLIRYLRREGAN